MKIFIKILLALSLFGFLNVSAVDNTSELDYPTTSEIKNSVLEKLKDEDNTFTTSEDPNGLGVDGVDNLLIQIAVSMKNFLFFISVIYFLIIVYKMIFNDDSEQGSKDFKKGFVWITLGLVITQLAYSFVYLLFSSPNQIGGTLASRIFADIVHPMISLIETGASFFFVAMMIYAFYRLITSDGEEDRAKEAKMTVVYAVAGFIVIKISRLLVNNIYGEAQCGSSTGVFYFSKCTRETKPEGINQLIIDIITWMSSFAAVIVLALIIYSGFLVLTANGESDKLDKAKKNILYITIGVGVMIASYLILRFGLNLATFTQ